jgi:hypothetical protein
MQEHLTNVANSTQQNQQMLEQMTALASTVSTLQTQIGNASQSQGGGNSQQGQGRRNNDRAGRGNGRGRGTPRRPPKYCWTHGNCAHSSSDCETKGDGHIAEATYSDMQGGSTTRCHWLT